MNAPDFSARLDHALAMNGKTNAQLANLVHPTSGHQKVSAWRKRERIGAKSLPQVRAFLPLTDMEWLQEGIGQPERERDVKNYPVNMGAASQSQKIDPVMMAEAEKWVRYEEGAGFQFQPVRRAERLIAIYELMQADGGILSVQHTEELISAARRIIETGGSSGSFVEAGRRWHGGK